MNVRLQLRIMIAALSANRFRTMMGIGSVVLAISSLTIMLALGAGTEKELQSIADQNGKNLFTIMTGQSRLLPGRGVGWTTSTKLRLTDAAALASQVYGITAVLPITDTKQSAKYERRSYTTSIVGVTPDFFGLRGFRSSEGRLIDEIDIAKKARVAVVGPYVVQQLGDDQGLVGSTILVGGVPFEVIGQLRQKGVSGDGTNEDDQIFIPLGAAMDRLLKVDYLSRLLVQVKEQDQMARIQDDVRFALRKLHRLDVDAPDDFSVLSLIKSDQAKKRGAELFQQLSKVLAIVTLAISGGGVFTMTYLNVRNRIPEIGLRMAIGAKRRQIAIMFTGESCLLSLVGGLVGLAVGMIGVAVIQALTNWQLQIAGRDAVESLCLALMLGFVFGVVPAIRASTLMPVDAMHAI